MTIILYAYFKKIKRQNAFHGFYVLKRQTRSSILYYCGRVSIYFISTIMQLSTQWKKIIELIVCRLNT